MKASAFSVSRVLILTVGSLRINLSMTSTVASTSSGLGQAGSVELRAGDITVDGSFVREVERSPLALAIVRSMAEIGRSLGKQTIAEFVDSDEVIAELRKIGVDFAQGYFLGKPKVFEPELRVVAAGSGA